MPQALAITHFGQVDDVAPHLRRMRNCTPGPPASAHGEEAFVAGIEDRIAERAPDVAPSFTAAAPAADQLYLGLRRYLDKRAAKG